MRVCVGRLDCLPLERYQDNMSNRVERRSGHQLSGQHVQQVLLPRGSCGTETSGLDRRNQWPHLPLLVPVRCVGVTPAATGRDTGRRDTDRHTRNCAAGVAVVPARSVSRLAKDAKSQHESLVLSRSRSDGSALTRARSRDPRKRAQGCGRTRFHGPQAEIILDTIQLQIRLKLVALLMNCSALYVS